MIECPAVKKTVVQWHYDLSTVFYRLLWGPHIHHGLWNDDESATVAQVQLTETMAELAEIEDGCRLVDIGCGMGASSIHLARTRGCVATGVTLSPLQARWASVSSRWHGVRNQTTFLRADAESVELPFETFDVVWSVECTEHLFDKATFFRRAAQWLRPGGRMAICAWLAGGELSTDDQKQQVLDVCEGFFCPSLGSAADYIEWMQDAGLSISGWQDWTSRVARTWDICERRVRRTGVRWLARLLDKDTVLFLDRFRTLRNAYDSGAMQYGCFIAEKPVDDVNNNGEHAAEQDAFAAASDT